MSAHTILLIYVIFFIGEFLWEQLLTLLNIDSVKRHRSEMPEVFKGYIPEASYRRSVEYTLARNRFQLLTAVISSAVLLLVVTTGVLGAVDSWLSAWNLNRYVHGIIYIFMIALAFRLFSLPFSLYSQFVLEERFGFNRMTPKLFLTDQLKGTLLSALLFIPLLLGLFWFMDSTGSLWWVYALVFVTLFQLVISVLYPLVISPLFNKFSPLEEGTLRTEIDSLAERLAFRTKGIFVMDGSRRSRHSNAYFTGLGKAKRIVLFDTLISGMSDEQVVSVLAHEIGHEKKKHIVKHLAVSVILTGVLFWVLGFLLHYEPLYAAFGFDSPSYHAILVILSFAGGPFTFFFTPLFSIWSRKHEYEADRFAVDAVGTALHLKEALMNLGKENLSNFTPHPLYSFYHYSHPTLAERVESMESYARQRTGGG